MAVVLRVVPSYLGEYPYTFTVHRLPRGWNFYREAAVSDKVRLQPVDTVDVTIVVDNSIDILIPGTELARRPPWTWDWSAAEQLRAEHGYSLLVTVTSAGQRSTLLY